MSSYHCIIIELTLKFLLLKDKAQLYGTAFILVYKKRYCSNMYNVLFYNSDFQMWIVDLDLKVIVYGWDSLLFKILLKSLLIHIFQV